MKNVIFTKSQIDDKIKTIPNYYDCAICTCESEDCNCDENINYDFENCKRHNSDFSNDIEFYPNCKCEYCRNFNYLYASEIQIIPELYLTKQYFNALKKSRV
jgi:hypothetical protein